MNKQAELWRFIHKRLNNKENVMLLVVAHSSGSSPGRPGFKMAVAADGALFGSIGGGMMEVKLVELAKKHLHEEPPPPFFKRQIHQPDAPADRSGMICSGEQTVIFFPLRPADGPTVRELAQAAKKARPLWLHLCSASGSRPVLEISKESPNDPTIHFTSENEGAFHYRERIGFSHRLLIIGGGHCALALSELAAKLGFYVTVYDDRPGLNTLARNRFAHEKRVLHDYDTIGRRMPEGPEVFVVVMTLGYRSDERVLRHILDKNFGYLGLLGSRSKVVVVLDNLREAGFSAAQIGQMHAPAGLPIGSHTPEEIAVSIAAQLVALKNGRAGDG